MAVAPAPDPWQWPPSPQLQLQPVGLLRLEGPDTLRVLHGQTSQAIEAARPGAWLSTCCISPTARLRALAEVLVDGQGAWLVITAGEAAAVRSALDRVLFPADRVELGPLQSGLLAEVVGGAELVGRAGLVGRAEAESSWQPLEGGGGWWLGCQRRLVLQQGTPLPAALASLPALDGPGRERWRLQQGLPASPGEINEETNPFELGLAERVSLSKGCYTGQETLAKLATYDGVKQQLRRWIWRGAAEGSGAGRGPEAELRAGTALHSRSGERAGRITSALALAGDAAGPLVIGLALVRRGALAQDTLLAGEAGEAIALSVPAGFVPPPIGPGG